MAWRATFETASRRTGSSWSRTVVGHPGVDRAAHPHGGGEAQDRDVLAHDRVDLGPQRAGRPVLELEDGAPDVADGEVQVGHRLLQPAHHLGGGGEHRGALQLQPGGEEPLDHAVVQVAGDPLAVGDDGELLPVGERRDPVQRQRGLVGEGDEQLALLVVAAARGPARTARPGTRARPGGPAAGSRRRSVRWSAARRPLSRYAAGGGGLVQGARHPHRVAGVARRRNAPCRRRS